MEDGGKPGEASPTQLAEIWCPSICCCREAMALTRSRMLYLMSKREIQQIEVFAPLISEKLQGPFSITMAATKLQIQIAKVVKEL